MADQALPPHRSALRVCLYALASAVASAALLTAAILAPAPPAVLPLVVFVGIGLPMGAAGDLPTAVRSLRMGRRGGLRRGHLQALRRQLAALPETHHPHGF